MSDAQAAITPVEKVIVKEVVSTVEVAATAGLSALLVAAPSLAVDTNWADFKVAGAAILISAATAAVAAGVKYLKSVLPKGTPNA